MFVERAAEERADDGVTHLVPALGQPAGQLLHVALDPPVGGGHALLADHRDAKGPHAGAPGHAGARDSANR